MNAGDQVLIKGPSLNGVKWHKDLDKHIGKILTISSIVYRNDVQDEYFCQENNGELCFYSDEVEFVPHEWDS